MSRCKKHWALLSLTPLHWNKETNNNPHLDLPMNVTLDTVFSQWKYFKHWKVRAKVKQKYCFTSSGPQYQSIKTLTARKILELLNNNNPTATSWLLNQKRQQIITIWYDKSTKTFHCNYSLTCQNHKVSIQLFLDQVVNSVVWCPDGIFQQSGCMPESETSGTYRADDKNKMFWVCNFYTTNSAVWFNITTTIILLGS